MAVQDGESGVDTTTISLCIADPSDVLYSCVGHAFFRVQTPTSDLCYSYEGEYVRQQVLTFLQGKLHMGMVCQPTADMLALYLEEQRGVKQYVMHLSADVERQLERLLKRKVGEGMLLPYDYFHRGCAVSCMRLIREAVASCGQSLCVSEWPPHFSETRRELVRDNLGHAPWNRFFLYNIVGSESDQPCDNWEKVVIPKDLVWVLQYARLSSFMQHVPSSLDSSRNDSAKGAAESVCVLSTDGVQLTKAVSPTDDASWISPWLIAAVILAFQLFAFLFSFGNGQSDIGVMRGCQNLSHASAALCLAIQLADTVLLGILFLLGTLQLYLIVFSSLPCTQWNWLAVVFNPIPFLVWKWKQRSVWRLYAIVCLLWAVVMLLLAHQIVDETHILLSLSLALFFWRSARKVRR